MDRIYLSSKQKKTNRKKIDRKKIDRKNRRQIENI